MKGKLNWRQATIGNYWYAEDFSICTRQRYSNDEPVMTWPDSGYLLLRNYEELGCFRTIAAAKRAAQALEVGIYREESEAAK